MANNNFAENLKLLQSLSSLIPDYDGDQATLSDFISACDFVASQVNENLMQGFLLVIKNKLSGKARQFISSRSLNDWNSIKQLLIGHFGDCRDTESLLRDLATSIQKPNETPRAFIQRIENLLTKLRNSVALDRSIEVDSKEALNESHEKIALKTLLAGLGDPIGSIIRAQRPQSIDEAIQFLIEEENIYYLKNKNSSKESKTFQKIVPKSNFSSEQKKDSKFCNYCKSHGHLLLECRKRAFNNQQQQNPQLAPRQQNNSQFAPRQPFANQNFRPQNPNPNSNRPSVIQRNPTVNHLNSQEETDTGDLSPASQESPEESALVSMFQNLSF